jgi:hypothetical protein
MTMADVFEFQDDGADDSGSLPSISGGKEAKSLDPPKSPSPEPKPKPTSPATSPPSTSVSSTNGSSIGLFAGGRTRHARNLKRQQEELEKKKLEAKEAKAKRHAKEKQQSKPSKKLEIEHDEDGEDDSTSLNSKSGPTKDESRNKPTLPRRRRKRKQLLTISKKAKRTGPTLSTTSGITELLSPLNGNGELFSPSSEGIESSISQQIQQKMQQHERKQQKLCPSPKIVVSRKIGGAGRNVYAVQDAGNHQMIHDECTELTSTILSCPKDKVLYKGMVLESVADLALMLSDKKTRSFLWQGENQKYDHENNHTLTSILDVLHHTTNAISEKLQHSNERWLPLMQRLLPVGKPPEELEPFASTDEQQDNRVENYTAGLMLDALVAIVTFLSWDVTVENQNSVYHKDNTKARSLRKAMLQHSGFLCSFVYLVRHTDPMVSCILETRGAEISARLALTQSHPKKDIENCHESESTPHTSNSGKVKHNLSDFQKKELSYKNNSQEMRFSQTSDLSSVNGAGFADSRSVASFESTSSQGTMDPTVAGRRKRRRKREGSVLEPIAEDALSFADNNGAGSRTPPRSPPRVVIQKTSDSHLQLSFPTENGLSPSRSPARRRDAPSQQNGDDASSMMSCDSLILNVHDKLSKARAKFSPIPQHSQTNKEHECDGEKRELRLSFGGRDPAGFSSLMALWALKRCLAGKEEGETHSCLDECDEQHQSEGKGFMYDEDDERMEREADDDENSNPLMQTNLLIEESGVMPFFAQGLAEVFSSLIEELSNEAIPCQACVLHLHDKIEVLAPIVDNSCLMADNNRSNLCAASILANGEEDNGQKGVLVGSLLLFLKQWTRHKSLTNGNKGRNNLMPLMNETRLTVLRTLTSLTHANSLSAEQFAERYRDEVNGAGEQASPVETTPSWTGVEVLGQILYQSASDPKSKSSKVVYDTRIFCLNTLTNIVREDSDGEIRNIFATMTFPNEKDEKQPVDFLEWLSAWVVGQTDSFRDSIMKGSFGNKQNGKNDSHSQRELTDQEHEQLAMAGNGCALLGSLLMEPSMAGKSKKDMDRMVQTIREKILSEMPLDDTTGLPSGTTFLKNTLRAWSNLLYFSIGDLSVALVAPVRKLISSLERMEVEIVS